MGARQIRRARKRHLTIVSDNHYSTGPCGPCRECCTVLAVDEIGKPSRQPCEHLTGRGCGVYAERPEICRQFMCGWLAGAVPRWARPDRHGILVALSVIAPGLLDLRIHETRSGAFKALPVKRGGELFFAVFQYARQLSRSDRIAVTVTREWAAGDVEPIAATPGALAVSRRHGFVKPDVSDADFWSAIFCLADENDAAEGNVNG